VGGGEAGIGGAPPKKALPRRCLSKSHGVAGAGALGRHSGRAARLPARWNAGDPPRARRGAGWVVMEGRESRRDWWWHAPRARCAPAQVAGAPSAGAGADARRGAGARARPNAAGHSQNSSGCVQLSAEAESAGRRARRVEGRHRWACRAGPSPAADVWHPGTCGMKRAPSKHSARKGQKLNAASAVEWSRHRPSPCAAWRPSPKKIGGPKAASAPDSDNSEDIRACRRGAGSALPAETAERGPFPLWRSQRLPSSSAPPLEAATRSPARRGRACRGGASPAALEPPRRPRRAAAAGLQCHSRAAANRRAGSLFARMRRGSGEPVRCAARAPFGLRRRCRGRRRGAAAALVAAGSPEQLVVSDVLGDEAVVVVA
jgi:hypothetical protein